MKSLTHGRAGAEESMASADEARPPQRMMQANSRSRGEGMEQGLIEAVDELPNAGGGEGEGGEPKATRPKGTGAQHGVEFAVAQVECAGRVRRRRETARAGLGRHR